MVDSKICFMVYSIHAFQGFTSQIHTFIMHDSTMYYMGWGEVHLVNTPFRFLSENVQKLRSQVDFCPSNRTDRTPRTKPKWSGYSP